MGVFLEPEDMRSKAIPQAQGTLQSMETDDIDDVFIIPAERMIAECCNLNLNTDGNPWRWYSRFESATNGARLLAEYRADYRLSVIATVNAMAANPLGEKQRGFQSASTIFSNKIVPPVAKALMRRWGAPRKLFRV